MEALPPAKVEMNTYIQDEYIYIYIRRERYIDIYIYGIYIYIYGWLSKLWSFFGYPKY